MLNKKILSIIKQGSDVWNEWRKNNPDYKPDLSDENLCSESLSGANFNETNLSRVDLNGADLRKAKFISANLYNANLNKANLIMANLSEASLIRADCTKADLNAADLSGADFGGANMSGANFTKANLAGADLGGTDLFRANFSGADLNGANFNEANLVEADLRGADLSRADLRQADLTGANLSGANLSLSILSETILDGANLINCRIYGIFARDIRLKGAEQTGLIITPREEFAVIVDNFEVAHFIGLLLNNEKILQLIDNITLRMVLILGSFTHQRKTILNVIRGKLLDYGFLPVLIEFDQDDSQKNFVETICTLGNMSKFIIADFTDVKALLGKVSQFLGNITVPIKPLLLKGLEQEYCKLSELQKNSKLFLKIHLYKESDDLSASFKNKIIDSIEIKNRLRLFH